MCLGGDFIEVGVGEEGAIGRAAGGDELGESVWVRSSQKWIPRESAPELGEGHGA